MRPMPPMCSAAVKVPAVLLIWLALLMYLGGCTASGPTLKGVDGSSVSPLDPAAPQPVVLVFSSPDCPIANAMAPELERLHGRTLAAGGTLYLVHARSDVTPALARSHAESHDLTMPVLLDPDHALVELVGATVTPEGVVLVREDGEWREVYQGKVNDLYASLGNRRDAPTQHWLRDAIDAAASGGIVTPAYRRPIGCFIERRP